MPEEAPVMSITLLSFIESALAGLEFLELYVREVVARNGLHDGAALLDVVYHFLQAVGEFLEVLLVEEDLMLVIDKPSVAFLPPLALGDGQVLIVSLCRLDVKEIGALSRPYRLRIDIVAHTFLLTTVVIILKVHISHFLVKVQQI